MKRAAVVIAVAKSGDLPVLEGAEAEAASVAAWLEGEGYDVHLLTDDCGKGSVRGPIVEGVLDDLVTVPPSYDFLLVYFTGHGAHYSRADHWLLSKAGSVGSDVINVGEAEDLAEISGIPNVVLVSDCCRVADDNVYRMNSMSGIAGFPIRKEYRIRTTDVDTIACSLGQEALELPLPDGAGGMRRASVLTEAWRRSYRAPTPESVATIVTPEGPVEVVPNRRLRDLISLHVMDVLDEADKSGLLDMAPDVRVPSRDDVYIARVDRAPGGPAAPPRPRAVADTVVHRSEVVLRSDDVVGTVNELFLRSESTTELFEAHTPNQELRDSFESQCGFVLPGYNVVRATIFDPYGGTATAAEPDPEPNFYTGEGVQFWHDEHTGAQVVRVWPGSATSTVITLTDGRTMVLPALPGFIGHLAIDDAGINSISWVPALSHWRSEMYEERRDELDALRAAATIAIDANRFVVDDEEHAVSLADRIRMGKGVDPTLGIYAGYAYHQAGREHDVEEVFRIMQEDGNPIFDVGLLAARTAHPDYRMLTPFCPLLTQGWNLLRSRGVPHLDQLLAVRPFVLDSLITTFAPEIGPELHRLATSGFFA